MLPSYFSYVLKFNIQNVSFNSYVLYNYVTKEDMKTEKYMLFLDFWQKWLCGLYIVGLAYMVLAVVSYFLYHLYLLYAFSLLGKQLDIW